MNPIFDSISGVISGILKPVLDKAYPDANERLAAEEAINAAIASQVIAQVEVNKIEAANANIFVAGWRPFVGWVCGSALAYTFVLQPFLIFILLVSGVVIPPLPVLDWSALSIILTGMLGIGAMRSFDKLKGTA